MKLIIAIVIVVAVALTACHGDSYLCATDTDCDVEGGRCERDGRCTGFDLGCPTQQRYTEHSGDRSNTCFDDATIPANACAAGQPPALREGCFADVCRALPSCCDTGWSEACVQDAQLRCGLACDTRLAITAQGNMGREVWTIRWDGAQWFAERPALGGIIAYLAPAPGTAEPRLAGFAPGNVFVVGDSQFPLATDHDYQTVTSVDFDRDGSDTVALAYQQNTPADHFVELLDLETAATRSFTSQVSTKLTWGDDDHDPFPDGVAGAGAGFRFLANDESPDHARKVSSTKSSGVGGDPTPGSPALRNFEWIDLDRDGLLDFAAFGSSLRIHMGNTDEIPNGPLSNLDCEPLVPAGQCALPQSTSYAGTAVPSIRANVKPALAVATFEAPFGGRNVYLVAVAQRDPVLLEIARIDACPTCQPLIALAARSLDADDVIDLIGIDTKLHVWTALSTRGMTFVESIPIATAATFNQINLSVTGAP